MKKLMMMAVGCALAFMIAGCGDSSSATPPAKSADPVANTPQELGGMFGKAMVQQDKEAFLKLCTDEAMSGKLSKLLAAFGDEGFKAEMKEMQEKNPEFSGEIKEPGASDIEKYGKDITIVQTIITVDGKVSTGPIFAAKKVDGSWKVIDYLGQ